MPVYSQFLTPVSAVTPAGGSPAVVGTAVDFGVVYSAFLAWISVDSSSSGNVTVFVDTSTDNDAWYLETGSGTTVDAGQAQAVTVQAGRYVRVRAYTPSGAPVLTVQVAVES
jgi:hypothetical protein